MSEYEHSPEAPISILRLDRARSKDFMERAILFPQREIARRIIDTLERNGKISVEVDHRIVEAYIKDFSDDMGLTTVHFYDRRLLREKAFLTETLFGD